jgi:hypothetical protein
MILHVWHKCQWLEVIALLKNQRRELVVPSSRVRTVVSVHPAIKSTRCFSDTVLPVGVHNQFGFNDSAKQQDTGSAHTKLLVSSLDPARKQTAARLCENSYSK